MTLEEYRQTDEYKILIKQAREALAELGTEAISDPPLRGAIKALAGATILRMLPSSVEKFYTEVALFYLKTPTVVTEDDKYWLLGVGNRVFSMFEQINPGNILERIVDVCPEGPVTNMQLCETEHLFLHPERLYKFHVGDCDKCKALASAAHNECESAPAT